MSQEYIYADRILNCSPSKNTERDWRFEHAVKAGMVSATLGLPTSVDLRAGNPWYDIGNQVDSGSCVGWGTADSVCRWNLVKACKLPMNQHLAVRFVWTAAKETDEFTSYPTTMLEFEGTSLKAALNIALKFGIPTDDLLPFRVKDAAGNWTGLEQMYRGDSTAFFANAANHRIASYWNLGTNMDNWRIWLASRGPVLTALGVDDTWFNATNTHGNLDVYHPYTVRGGHCVAFVGYTPNRFIVRNSWGTGWGDNGYAYASIPYAQAAFREAYGVIV